MTQDFLLTVLNSFAGRYLFLDWFVTAIIPYFFLILILFIIKRRSLQQMLVASIALLVTLGIDITFDSFLAIPRPFVVQPVTVIAQHAATNAFPSMHTLVAFTLAFSVFFFSRKEGMSDGIVALLLAAIIGLARLYLGVHWTVDVVAGIVISFVNVSLVYYLVQRYKLDELIEKYIPRTLRRVLKK